MTETLNIDHGGIVNIDVETTQRLVTELREARNDTEVVRGNVKAERDRANAAENERDFARIQLAQVTAERDDLAQKLSGKWIDRKDDARVLNDEHQQVVNECERLAQANFGLTHQLMLTKRDLDRAERTCQTLSTMFSAAIGAVAEGAL